MKNLNVKKIFIPGVYLVAVISVIACVFLTISSINKYFTEKREFTYSVNGIINDDIIPVQGTENNENKDNPTAGDNNEVSIIRPYKAENVSVGRYFYDFEAEAKNQENAIIFYENTYMQNSGVDYVSENSFDVISILDGKVLSVETDDVLGNIVKVEHDKEVVSVYQGIDKVMLKVGDKVTQGQVIGTSGSSSINANYTTSLHFEIYYKGTLIDPESLYTRNLKDL